VAIFGNGYNSDSGKVALFVLDLKTGALLRSLVVDDVTKDDAPKDDAPKNGLAAPATLDHDRDGYADYVYAGDLTGRLFRFDLRATNPDDWSVDFGGKPMFDAGPTQPITSAPVITPVDINGVATVAFGTGRFLGAGDRTDQNQQALYGVRDAWVGKAGGPSIPITPSQLTEQKVLTQTDLNGRTVLTVSNEPLLDTSLGWRLPLESLGAGARVVATPILRGNTLVLMVIIPSTDDCASGGSSVMLALNALTGGRQPFVAIDGNGDGILDEKDYLNSVVISGVSFDGIASLGGIQNNPGGTSTIQISSSENGGIGKDSQWTLDNSGEPRLGRLSWELLE
jgi:type IV pilus assembly protein PilY1